MKKFAVVTFVTFLLAGLAAAQIPTKGNVFFGYSYLRANFAGGGSSNSANLNGWNGSLEGNFLPWIGLVADISGQYGTQHIPVSCTLPVPPGCPTPPTVSVDGRLHSILFGPRVSVSVGKIRPFAHALVGVSHTSASGGGFSDSDTSLGSAFGGGIDYRLFYMFGWRVQGDLLHTRFFSNSQNNFRLSTGIVLRF